MGVFIDARTSKTGVAEAAVVESASSQIAVQKGQATEVNTSDDVVAYPDELNDTTCKSLFDDSCRFLGCLLEKFEQ